MANAQPYASYEEDYNAAGQRTALRAYYDDGTWRRTNYDTTGAAWSISEEDYNASNQRIAERTYNDNGSRRSTYFDPLSQATWSLIQEDYNTGGSRIRQITDYDDGVLDCARLDTSWDANNHAPWQMQTTQYAANDAFVRIYGIMDDFTAFG